MGAALRSWWEERVLRRLALNALVRRTGNFSDVRWLGRPVWQNIADVWTIQEVLSEERVDLVVECGTHRGGSAYFMASVFDLLGRGRVLSVDVAAQDEPQHDRIEYLRGSSTDPEMVDRVYRRARELGAERVLVVLDSDHSAGHVLDELRAYADLVPVGGHLAVQDGVIDELRRFRRGRPGPLAAIRRFVAEDQRFEVDEALSGRFLYNHSPSGWLRRLW